VSSQYETLSQAADAVSARLGRAPVGVVLGSGLSEALDSLEQPKFMQYDEIPGMPLTKVTGHPGSLVFGRIGDTAVLALCGRIHIYEGRAHDEVAFGVRLLSMLGVHTLLITSAVGSADRELQPGHIMLVEDHVNLSGVNVLAGEEDTRMGPRFPDLTHAYDPGVLAVLEDVATRMEIATSRGVLAHFHGPSYETPAEVRLIQRIGARAVSMSMVPEVLVARQRGMRVGGLGSVTNFAAGLVEHKLSHSGVLKSSASNADHLQGLLAGSIPQLATWEPSDA
jgi:purine-nucleoside phosphorylase